MSYGMEARNLQRHRRRGSVLLYTTATLIAIIGFAAVAIDFGALRLAKTELQTAADAAALYGVTGLDRSPAEARRRVRESLAENPVQGRQIQVSDARIEFGVWDVRAREFRSLPERMAGTATAIRVHIEMTDATNGRVRGAVGSAAGLDEFETEAIAVAIRGEPFDLEVPANASPYLAGMPRGTQIEFEHINRIRGARDKDTGNWLPSRHTEAGLDDPLRVPITVHPGQVLYFRQVRGGTGDWASGGQEYSLDGNLNRPNIRQRDVNGYRGVRAPLNAMMGVFLKDGERPDSIGDTGQLDFNEQRERDFNDLEPEKKQVFFIGDGVNNNAERLQRFIVPDDVDTLYLGIQDEYGFWWDNFGSVSTTMFTGDVQLVQ
jgi:hypothetical protein